MEIIHGPLGFNDLEREGLLIEGFDQPQTFEEQYNYDYYQKLIEGAGYEKEIDYINSNIICNNNRFFTISNKSNYNGKYAYTFNFAIKIRQLSCKHIFIQFKSLNKKSILHNRFRILIIIRSYDKYCMHLQKNHD